MFGIRFGYAYDRSRTQDIIERIKKRNKDQRELEKNEKKEKQPVMG